ncbi:hypothetical protein NXX23_20740 [Bacteroides ovatus]|nr:hypothetical protein [Bacteroides ovatus]
MGRSNQSISILFGGDHFINEVIEAAEKKKNFDEEEFFNQSRMYENEWVNPSNRISYNEGGDGIKLARQIYKNTQKKSFDKIIKYTSI